MRQPCTVMHNLSRTKQDASSNYNVGNRDLHTRHENMRCSHEIQGQELSTQPCAVLRKTLAGVERGPHKIAACQSTTRTMDSCRDTHPLRTVERGLHVSAACQSTSASSRAASCGLFLCIIALIRCPANGGYLLEPLALRAHPFFAATVISLVHRVELLEEVHSATSFHLLPADVRSHFVVGHFLVVLPGKQDLALAVLIYGRIEVEQGLEDLLQWL